MKNTQQCMGEGVNEKHSTMYGGGWKNTQQCIMGQSMKNTQQCMGEGVNEKKTLNNVWGRGSMKNTQQCMGGIQ